jgi:hypothetical protein
VASNSLRSPRRRALAADDGPMKSYSTPTLFRRDHVEVRYQLVVGDYTHVRLERSDKVAEENADIQPRGA